VEKLSKVRRLVFAASLLGLRRGGRVRRAGGGWIGGGGSRGRNRRRGGLNGYRSGLRPPEVLRQGFLRPGILFLRRTPVQELHQERSDSSGSEDEDGAGDPGRLAVDEAEELSQVIQNPFIAAAGSKGAVPWVVIGIRLFLEPVPHGVDIEADLVRVKEPEALATIRQDNEFGCLPDPPPGGQGGDIDIIDAPPLYMRQIVLPNGSIIGFVKLFVKHLRETPRLVGLNGND